MPDVKIMVWGLVCWLVFVGVMIWDGHRDKQHAKRARIRELWRWYDEHYGEDRDA